LPRPAFTKPTATVENSSPRRAFCRSASNVSVSPFTRLDAEP
jgi:hypothetical protein